MKNKTNNSLNSSKIPFLYIFSGYGQLDLKTGKINPTAGSYDLVRNRIVFSEETGIFKTNKPQYKTELKKEKKYSAWFTNINGVLQKVSDKGFGAKPGRLAKVEKSRSFYLPPKDIVIQTMYSQKQGWQEFFSNFFESNPDVEFTSLAVTGLSFDKFRKPDPKNDSREEKSYLSWYDNIKKKNEKIYGYLLLKTKAVVFVFTNEIFEDSTIVVTTPDNVETQDIDVLKIPEGVVCATLVQTNTIKLSKGLYKIKVTLPKDCKIEKFNKTNYDEKTKRVVYETTRQIDFNITNTAGEFDIICCDPVSVEESILTSFSFSYPHLIQALKKREPYSDYKYTKKGEDKFSDLPDSIKVISDQMNWMNTKSQIFLKLLDADGAYPRGWIIGNAVNRAIETENLFDETAKKALNLVFTTKLNINAWNDFVESMNTYRAGELPSYLSKIDDGKLAGFFLKGTKLDKMTKVLSNSAFAEKIKLYHVNTKDFIESIPGLTKLSDAIAWLDVIISANSLIGDAVNISTKAENVEQNQTQLFKKAKKYIELNGEEQFNREDMAEIEKYHLSTILEKAGVDDETIKFVQDSLTTVIATSCAIPGPTQSLGLIIAFLTGVYSVLKAGINFIDSAIFESEWQDYIKNKEMLGIMANIGEENRNFMRSLDPDDKAQNLVLQVCIRYEAVSGLVRLMTRAGLIAEDGMSEYSEIISKYKIDKYIERYILNDNWVINKKGFNPVGLDEDWYYENWLNENDYANFNIDAEHKFEWFNNSKESDNASNNVISNFQKIYPIHFTNSVSYEEISKDFQTIYPGIHSNCIEHSAVYFRESDMTDEEAKDMGLKDNGWQPVKPGQDNVISPLHQIRVLIVLKADTPKGIYPVSIRVNRVDGLINLKGPKYRRFIHEIESSLLDSEKSTWAEGENNGKKIKRLGCVFYPFYYLGKEKIFGLKPIAFDIIDARTKYNWNFFKRMRYSISAIVGTGHSESFLDLGKIENNKSVKSAYNEISLKIDKEDDLIKRYKVNKNGLSNEAILNKDKEKMKKMLDGGYLALRTSEFQYPALFDIGETEGFGSAGKGGGPFYIRFDDKGPYELCQPGNFIIPGGGNCWDNPVEIIMIVWCKKQHTNFKRYEKIGLSADNLPISARLINYDGFDTKGPLVQTTLNYLGFIEKSEEISKQAAFTKKIRLKKHPKLKPLVDALESDHSKRVNLINQIGFFNDVAKPRHYEGDYDIFAAHFKMNYETSGEKRITGVRPFSKKTFGDNHIKYPDYYRYSFIDIKMPERIGLDISNIFGIDKTNVAREYEFHFQAPEDYFTIKKWIEIEHIDKWIGDIPKSIDAR